MDANPTTTATQTTTPAPKNGATQQTPAPPPAKTSATEIPELVQAKEMMRQAEEKFAAAERRATINSNEAKKFADEKKGIGQKLSEYERLRKEREYAKVNKSAYLKSLYGDDWRDQILNELASGGAPSADAVAAEIERAKEEWRKELESHQAALSKQAQEAEAKRTQAELEEYRGSAAEYLKSNAKDYPLFLKHIGGNEAAADAVMRIIRDEHDRTAGRDEDGNITKRGVVLSFADAAAKAEAHLAGLLEEALAHEKYKTLLTDKMKPANVPAAGAQKSGAPGRTEAERRTLSNDLTASTPDAPRQAVTDEERRKRALAAFESVRAKAPA